MAKRTTTKGTTARKATSKKATAKKPVAKKTPTRKAGKGLLVNDIVQVVHDNDPAHEGAYGRVLSVGDRVRVHMVRGDSPIERVYLPAQLKKYKY